MLAPYRWIQDYASVDCAPAQLAEKMIMTGNGVEDIAYIGENIQNVLIGRIASITKHPNADKLVVCQLDIGQDELVQIVTGATNVFEGAIVPVALAPAQLPGGPIKRGKLRGEASNGMLCSGSELLLTEEDIEGASVDGILILPNNAPVGMDIRDYLNMRGAVLDFEVGANRPDCLSIIGLAREASAACECGFELPATNYVEGDIPTEDLVSVRVDAPDLCPRYMAGGITDVRIGPSPEWIRKRLIEAGIRPINNIVDITNFVMVETGQPMHAFDADKIRNKQIIVRRAQAGERMRTLDGKERVFTDSMLLICDGEGPTGIAGVMGGLESEITESTRRVVFEAAKFAYGNIRQTSRGLGLSTESSMRFSKGVDAQTTGFALSRALSLVEQLGAGVPTRGVIDLLDEDVQPRIIKTTGARINQILGTAISARDMQRLLERVFIRTGLIGDELICTIPVFRADIAGPNDIAEEVARMYGYDNIEETEAAVTMRVGQIDEAERKKDRLCQYLVDTGFFECTTYGFASTADYTGMCQEPPESVRILNPLGDDRSLMRQSLLPAMFRTIASNQHHGNMDLRLFESARTFTPTSDTLPDEREALCVAMSGTGADFAALRGVLENVARLVSGHELRVKAAELSCFSPIASGEIIVKGQTIGVIGQVADDACGSFGMSGNVYVAQIDLPALLAIDPKQRRYEPIGRFPAATRDIAVVVDASVGAGDMLDAIRDAGGPVLERVELLSVYEGSQLEAGKKSVAYALSLRGKDKTLTDKQVDHTMGRILKGLEKKFSARLR